MTASPAGIELTAAADARLAAYLDQVRAAVGGSADVSADEVAADIREHIECELGRAARPVGLVDLEAVLGRLGPPHGWLASGRGAAAGGGFAGVRPYLRERWQAAREVLWRGSDDWRLAYLAFGVFALGVVLIPAFPLFLMLSYVLSRAGLAAAREKGVELGAARKWLLYPPVAIVSTVLLLAAVAVPFGATAGIAAGLADVDYAERWELAGRPADFAPYRIESRSTLEKRYPEAVTTQDRLRAGVSRDRYVGEGLVVAFVGAGVFALWGAVVGLLAGAFPGAVRAVFPPLLDGFGGRTASRVGVVCLLGLGVWGGFAYRFLSDAGLV